MKLPANRFHNSADEAVERRIHMAAHALLPWRVHGRRAGYHVSLTDEDIVAHDGARSHLVQCCEDVDELLSGLSRPQAVDAETWSYWIKAVAGLLKTPEVLLALSGEEFRKFQLAMFEFGNAFAAQDGGAS